MTPTEPLAIDLHAFFTAEDFARGAAASWFAATTESLGFAADLALASGLVFTAPGRRLAAWCSARATKAWIASVLFLTFYVLIRESVALPFSIARYVASLHFGISNTTVPDFARQLALRLVLEIAGFCVIGATLGAVRARWPRRWWLLLGSVSAIVLVGDAIAEPWIQQASYVVSSLPSGPLRTRIETLARAQHEELGDIQVIDSSRFGRGVDAFVTGFGPTRRIVLTDTLLQLGDEATVGAVAHEIGHRRSERMPVRLALAAFGLVALLWMVERCVAFARRRGALFDAHAFPFVIASISLVFTVISPLRAALGRDEEREADRVELSVRRDYDAYVTEQIEIVRRSALEPEPTGAARWFDDHPSPAERIGLALWYKESHDSAANGADR